MYWFLWLRIIISHDLSYNSFDNDVYSVFFSTITVNTHMLSNRYYDVSRSEKIIHAKDWRYWQFVASAPIVFLKEACFVFANFALLSVAQNDITRQLVSSIRPFSDAQVLWRDIITNSPSSILQIIQKLVWAPFSWK